MQPLLQPLLRPCLLQPPAPVPLPRAPPQGLQSGGGSLSDPRLQAAAAALLDEQGGAGAGAILELESQPLKPEDVGLPVLELFLRPTPDGRGYEQQAAALYAPEAALLEAEEEQAELAASIEQFISAGDSFEGGAGQCVWEGRRGARWELLAGRGERGKEGVWAARRAWSPPPAPSAASPASPPASRPCLTPCRNSFRPRRRRLGGERGAGADRGRRLVRQNRDQQRGGRRVPAAGELRDPRRPPLLARPACSLLAAARLASLPGLGPESSRGVLPTCPLSLPPPFACSSLTRRTTTFAPSTTWLPAWAWLPEMRPTPLPPPLLPRRAPRLRPRRPRPAPAAAAGRLRRRGVRSRSARRRRRSWSAGRRRRRPRGPPGARCRRRWRPSQRRCCRAAAPAGPLSRVRALGSPAGLLVGLAGRGKVTAG